MNAEGNMNAAKQAASPITRKGHKARRRALMLANGLSNTGRQWVKLRKWVRYLAKQGAA